jgi:hypothetical protein
MTAIAFDAVVPRRARADTRWFYVGMAGIFVLIAFGGFIPTYWARLAAGTFNAAPIVHFHGGLFFLWTAFFFVQTALVASGHTADHRAWGLAGVSLATAMVISVVLTAINSMRLADGMNFGDQARLFAIVPLSSVVVFAAFMTAAIVQVKQPELHKRLMILSMIPLMQAAMARVFLTLFSPPGALGPPPVFVAVPPGLLVDLLIVGAMVHDWRTRGRPHPVYWIGGALLIASQLLLVPLSATPMWMAIARWVQALPG